MGIFSSNYLYFNHLAYTILNLCKSLVKPRLKKHQY
nr:MAG TPA: hypothetical protein [Caudoviricetes sp.]DAR41089.1 MAG TPA: hypothetical protein [Caudoviricetes sp.]